MLMSITALVSQVEMCPYVAWAFVEFKHHAETADWRVGEVIGSSRRVVTGDDEPKTFSIRVERMMRPRHAIERMLPT